MFISLALAVSSLYFNNESLAIGSLLLSLEFDA